MYQHEESHYKNSVEIIAGIDEAGRGPLAGPVVAAAVVLPRATSDEDLLKWQGVNDSKKISAKKREKIFATLLNEPQVVVGVGIVSERSIDKINILKATQQAMRKALSNLEVKSQVLLIDGMTLPGTNIQQQKIINGDSLSLSIAAASIIAKVTRDRIMCEYHELYPQYRFDKHKGYGTREHIKILKEYGPCKIHRRSFQPIALMEEIGFEMEPVRRMK